MRHIQRFLMSCLSIAVVGCSIHPLPQDVTGYDTYQIVSKIRCEARDAIRGYAISFIAKTRPDLANELRAGALSFRNFNRKHLDETSQRVLKKYGTAAIAYDFSFDITETNNLSASAELLRKLSHGPLKISLSAGNERERQNIRNFRVTDTFENLISVVPDEYCKDSKRERNWLYPITGTVGLQELIGTFLDLNQSGNLAAKGGKDGGEVPSIADTIEFTTKVTGSVNPKIELSPVGRGLQLASGGLKFDGTRIDIHKVIVAVALPDETKKKGSKSAGSTAKAIANQALDEQVVRKAIIDRKKVDDKILRIIE